MTKRFRISLIYFIVVLLTLGLRIASALDIYSALGIDDADAFFTCIVQLIIFGIVPLGLYFLFGLNKKDENIKTFCPDFGFKKISFKQFVITILIAICMIVVSTGFSFVWQIVLYVIGYTRVSSSTDYYSIGILFKELALTAMLPAIFEELSHRGLLAAGYRKTGYKYVVVSAVLFSLMHQNIAQTGYAMLDGAIMALCFYYTGSVFPGMIIHFMNNGLVVIEGYAAQNGGALNFINVVSNYLTTTIAGLLISIFVIIVCIVLMCALFYSLREIAVKKQIIIDTPFYINFDEKPLYKDAMFLLTVLVGIIATVFSLVWGIMR